MILQPGSRPISGSPEYDLVRKLGVGAFGEVWHAHGPGGIDVALKVIRLGSSGGDVELRSLDATKRIRHPNLVSLFAAWTQEDWLILAMELCDQSLQDRLDKALVRSGAGIPVEELLKFMSDAAEGLDSLNARHVQHRDVKPANLLVLGTGVKVGDFGLAKVLDRTVASNSGSGTIAYMAPECFRGSLAPQSDQYSLAVTYYHLRTGRPLFIGNQAEVMYAHLEGSPDLSGIESAERVVLTRALGKLPQNRWSSCKEFVTELAKSHKPADGGNTDHVVIRGYEDARAYFATWG